MRWLGPSIVLVAMALLLVAALGDGRFHAPRQWFLLTFVLWILILAVHMVQGWRADRPPIEPLRKSLRVLAPLLLGGTGIAAYNAIKSGLNQYPLWADPILAEIDLALFGFLYTDRFMGFSRLYSFSWFLFLMLSFTAVALRRDGERRSALLLGHFLLWCLFAPLVQWLVPAGGPIFYERLGHGALFEGIAFHPSALAMSDYLWRQYEAGGVAFGSGISAMPSMHVASSAWAALAWRGTPLAWPAAAFAGLIFLLSVALGWHYALDGIVGAGLALAAVALARRALQRGTGEVRELPA